MIESAAMLIHLADAHPQSHLAPSPGTTAHAMFLQWMVFLSANAYEAALRMCYPARYSAQGEPDAPGIRGQGEIDFLAHLGLISERLNPYVLGDRYSVADVYLYMLATWYTGDMSALYARLPGLGAHAALIATRPTIAKVEADHVR